MWKIICELITVGTRFANARSKISDATLDSPAIYKTSKRYAKRNAPRDGGERDPGGRGGGAGEPRASAPRASEAPSRGRRPSDVWQARGGRPERRGGAGGRVSAARSIAAIKRNTDHNRRLRRVKKGARRPGGAGSGGGGLRREGAGGAAAGRLRTEPRGSGGAPGRAPDAPRARGFGERVAVTWRARGAAWRRRGAATDAPQQARLAAAICTPVRFARSLLVDRRLGHTAFGKFRRTRSRFVRSKRLG